MAKKNSDKSFSTLKLLVLIVQQVYKSYTQALADSEIDSNSDQIGSNRTEFRYARFR